MLIVSVVVRGTGKGAARYGAKSDSVPELRSHAEMRWHNVVGLNPGRTLLGSGAGTRELLAVLFTCVAGSATAVGNALL